MKKILFIYKYSNVSGGINSMIHSFIDNAKSSYHFYILTDDSSYKSSFMKKENNIFISELNIQNVLKISKNYDIESIVIFEPFFKYTIFSLLFKVLRPRTRISLYFVGSGTEYQTFIGSMLLKFSKKYFYSFLAISKYCASKSKIDNIDILPCPISIQNYTITNSLHKKKIVILDRIRDRKNQLDAIRAFNIVHKVHPDATLSIIGDLYKVEDREELKDYAKEVVNLVNEYRLGNYVVYYGEVTEKEKIKILSNSSLMLKTSIHEMQGISTTEGMASGLPIVAFANTGTIETVQHAGGVLVKDKDFYMLADTINNLFNNQKKIEELSLKSFKASLRYDDKHIAKEFYKFIGVDND